MRRIAFLLLLAAADVLAQGMPPPSRVDSWESKRNQRRLQVDFAVLPDATPKKLPDGTTEPAKAPWPFVIYVQEEESKGSGKIDANVFSDTRFVLATQACKLIRLKPGKAIDIPWLASVPNIKDPTLIVVDREFRVVGTLREAKEFTANALLPLMTRAADAAYPVKLAAYVSSQIEILKEGEKLWKEEKALEEMATRAGEQDKAKQEKVFREVEERTKALGEAEDRLTERELALKDSLKPEGPKAAPIPATVGSGRKKRPLTPQELEAIESFREFQRNENPTVRAAAMEDLGAVDSPVIVETILGGTSDLDPEVLVAAGKALGRMKSDESLQAMADALLGGKERAKIAVANGFAHIQRKFPPSVAPLSEAAKSRNDDLRRVAVQALGAQQDPAAAPVLLAALDDPLPAIRVIAASALGDARVAAAGNPLVERLSAGDWSLRKAAIESLGKLRGKESIPPLVELFQKEDGLLVETIHQALVAITGEDFGLKPNSWKHWWEKFGGSFQVPTEAQLAEAKKRAEHALDGYAKPDKVTYHKIQTLSKKLVFLIDFSSSMGDKIVIPPDAPESVQKEFPDRVKIEIAKRELIEILSKIDDKVYFNVIAFAGRLKPFSDTLVPASQRAAAIKFVSKLQAMPPPRTVKESGEEQKTNTWAALMAGFGLQDQAVPDWKSRAQADTIFLVSDGLPTAGEIVDVPKLVAAATEMNRSRGVVIHVITFDRNAAGRLRPLAEQNGGKCILRGY
jgi:hypothetical protein